MPVHLLGSLHCFLFTATHSTFEHAFFMAGKLLSHDHKKKPHDQGLRCRKFMRLNSPPQVLVAVVFWFEWAFCRDTKVFGLFRGQFGQFGSQVAQVEFGDFLVQLFRQDVEFVFVCA